MQQALEAARVEHEVRRVLAGPRTGHEILRHAVRRHLHQAEGLIGQDIIKLHMSS